MRPFGPPSSRLRSPDFSAIAGAPLTDGKIKRYMLAGFYGDARRLEALAEDAILERKRKPDNVALALAALSNL